MHWILNAHSYGVLIAKAIALAVIGTLAWLRYRAKHKADVKRIRGRQN